MGIFFLTQNSIIQKYDLRCNFLIYFQVVSAIPRHFVESVRANPTDRPDLLLNNMFHFPPEIHKFNQNEK